MRKVLYKKLNQKCFKSSKESFLDLLSHLKNFKQWNELATLRLNEVLLMDASEPWTGKELNELCLGDQIICPILLELSEWTGDKYFHLSKIIVVLKLF